MGELSVTASRDAEQMRFFMKCVLQDMDALDAMLTQGNIESDRRRIGAEQEVFLVDQALGPTLTAEPILKELNDPHFTHELALFNIEYNLDPVDFDGDGLRKIERQACALLDRLRKAATHHETQVVLAGILPTLRQRDVTLDAMTPKPRYKALNEVMTAMRGGAFRLRMRGVDELNLEHDSMMLEACNTSFQVHLQVAAEEFAPLYNASQFLAAPVVALACNSPLLFERRLWRETRLALFQQSVDTRSADIPERSLVPRVSFGTQWVKESVTEIFREDVSRFRALLGNETYNDPFEALKRGEAPTLDALRLHNGTVYRWNRACYGISDGKPHLRIENRLLPAGPTILDEVANAAFWLGAVLGFYAKHGDPQHLIDFDDAKANLVDAARNGIDAKPKWIDGERYAAADLVLEHLLPLAESGLTAQGIDANDRERYLGVISARAKQGRTGARWQLRSLAGMGRDTSAAERSSALVKAMIQNQREGRPVHEWELASGGEVDAWKEHYGCVSSFMTTDIFTVHHDELLDLAARMMDWGHIRHVPVEDDDHRLVGLVSHRSMLRFLLQGPSQDQQVAVSEVMQESPITVRPETSSLDAIRLMKEHRIACLPVVDRNQKLLGIVTDRDFMNVAGQLLQKKLSE
ncbi:MAG: glutamate-cysteine ligase family protein [Planctomycetes bacterium]|nr:glutamate-cysteine ligase family protein [Planctomycetota bacterium]